MPDYTYPIWSLSKNGLTITIEPEFVVDTNVTDIIIQGGVFKAVYIPETGFWSRNQGDAWKQIDANDEAFAKEEHPDWGEARRVVKLIRRSSSGMIKRWNDYVKNQMIDSEGIELDSDITFLNTEVTKEMYRSKHVNYALQEGPHPCWDELMGRLYSPENLHKLEWAIGCILSGDSKKTQKFVVLYGDPGSGKGTFIKIAKKLFAGYYVAFDAASLANRSNQFGLEQFHGDPLVAFQEDGDLSRIEDNTKLNSIISHEEMMVNEKNKSVYTNWFKAFLFMGTNRPVKITDGKSGIIRRLIDVNPTNHPFKKEKYLELLKGTDFELGAIAKHCLDVYLENPGYYDNYTPIAMMENTNHFYNFMLGKYDELISSNGATLGKLYEDYKKFCSDANFEKPLNRLLVKNELTNYFDSFVSHTTVNGEQVWSYYSGFKYDKFNRVPPKDILEKKEEEQENNEEVEQKSWLQFTEPREPSQLDIFYADYPATYAVQNTRGEWIPDRKWDSVNTKLMQIDPAKMHYVRTPINLIIIDFDLKKKDENGKMVKDFERNLEAASKWPPTYAELSKSGAGIHLHYIYDGDPTQLSNLYDTDIEIKVYSGKSALRRILTLYCNLAIAHISSNLPLKEIKKRVIDKDIVETESSLQAAIESALEKKVKNVTPSTRCCIDYIYWILEKAYESGVIYDLSDMYDSVWNFAADSSHQAPYCIMKVEEMHFKSEEPSQIQTLPEKSKSGLRETVEDVLNSLVVLDIEVKPDLLLVCYSVYRNEPVFDVVNPSPADVRLILDTDFAAFNGVRYDNLILYYRGVREASIPECYQMSHDIISGNHNGPREAKNASKFDIYDILDNENRMGLKKLEIRYHMKHLEMETDWDAPLSGPEELEQMIKYCKWDVIAAKEVVKRNKGALSARMMLTAFATARCTVAKSTMNTTENVLTQRLILGNDIYNNPQGSYYWRDYSQPVTEIDDVMRAWLIKDDRLKSLDNFVAWDGTHSILPYWPGYKFEFIQKTKKINGIERVVTIPHSSYRGIDIGEGGLVLFFPGIYYKTICMDVNGEHPTSYRDEYALGPYTEAYAQLNDAKDYLKHKEFDKMAAMFDGLFIPYLQDKENIKPMRTAVKRACNAVYGQGDAHYDNPLKDPNNIDNFIAKRGSLFMVDLYYAVLEKGYQVAHTKTDSIKIPNYDEDMIQWMIDFGNYYGYRFEIEHKFEKFCLVNGSTYIAKLDLNDPDWMAARDDAISRGLPEPTRWTATAAEFQHPYVFKTLFSKEPIDWYDYWETKQVSDGTMYLDMNEEDIYNAIIYADKECVNEFISSKKKQLYAEDFMTDPDLLETYLKWRAKKHPELEPIDIPHNYQFIGSCGAFVPVRCGEDGGILLKKDKTGKYVAVNGTKGYRWMEVEIVEEFYYQDKIDISYYRKLVDDAKDHITEVGMKDGIDFDMFVSDWTPDLDKAISDLDGVTDEIEFNDPEVDKQIEELRSQGIYI